MERDNIATCAQTCDTRTPENPSFSDLTTAFGLKGGNMTSTQFEAAKELWRNCSPAKKRKLYEALDSGAHFKVRLDWLISDFPEPQPTFLSGQEQDRLREQGIPLVQVKYNGKFLICTRATMELFGLEWVRDW